MSKNTLYLVVGLVITILFTVMFSMTGGDETVVTSATEVVKSATGVVASSARFWVFLVLGALALGAWSAIKYNKDKGGKYTPPKWAFAVLIGLPVFHWMFWAIAPELWSQWLHSKTFWPANLAVMAIMPVVNFKTMGIIAAFIAVPVVSGALLGIVRGRPLSNPIIPTVSASVTTNRTWHLPAEIVLPVIAECESGGRQFDDEGGLIRNSESTAIGKYQIMASLHEERARGMGFDIRTEEGNEAYAKILFSESGTEHWEADPRSRACWEPKLLTYGGGASGANTYVARAGQPVVISIPPMHRWDAVGEFPIDKIYYSALKQGRNRIETFEVMPPATEASFQIVVTKCQSIEACAW